MSPHQAAPTAFSRLNKASLGTRRLPHCAKIDCACLLRDLRFQLIQIKSGSKISDADKGGSDKKALTMGASTIVCVEVERPNGPLRKWEDTLSAHVGHVDPALRGQEALSCLPMDKRSFMGRIEYSALGEMFLCKFAATNYQFTRSLTTPTPTLPIPIMLVSVSRGSCKFFQCGHTCILTEGDWTLIDTKQPLGYIITSPEIEAFVMMLPRPSDAAITALFERGFARQSNGGWGLSRGPARHGERELRRDAPSFTTGRKKTGCGHDHDGMGRLARADRDAAGDRTPRRTIDAGQGLYRGESRRSRALRRADLARMQHFPSWAAPPFRRGSGRIRIELFLAASAHPLRGDASRPEPGASLDYRRLLLIRLQQFVAFQPAVQGSVRSSAGSLSRPAGLPPSGDPASMLVHGVADAIVDWASARTRQLARSPMA